MAQLDLDLNHVRHPTGTARRARTSSQGDADSTPASTPERESPSPFPAELRLPKNHSTGDLLRAVTEAKSRGRFSLAFDPRSPHRDDEAASGLPAVPTDGDGDDDDDGGDGDDPLTLSAFRQHRPFRTPTLPSTSSSSASLVGFGLPRSASTMAISVPTSRLASLSGASGGGNGPLSPTLIAPTKKTIDDFVILEDIGQGAYGQVKLARYKKATMKKMVLKYVTKRRILVDTWTRDRRLGTVPLEIHVLDYLRRDGLRHPNIVEMTDFFEDDVNYYIEMVPHGLPGMDLFDYIELRVNLDESECRSIFRQVANAVHHLHTKALVVHRDIKDENVVLDRDGKIKLIDFGSATYVKNGPFDVFVGTIDYAAPEVLAGHRYRGKEQDVWALGILLYTIVYKENPFYSVEEIMDHELRVPFVQSEDCLHLIRCMLDRDVGRRIAIAAVLNHPWLRPEVEEEDAELEAEAGGERGGGGEGGGADDDAGARS
ncbi:MAG: hypothetical protein M1826_005556 [Phylliscum demangeonii]|nr:MAG: hypothetical protein M1826_005556 [Phylliscum demangeonii]